jgi:hypothetical protein
LKRCRFPRQIISQAVWLYLWLPLRLALVGGILLERAIAGSCEMIRRSLATSHLGLLSTAKSFHSLAPEPLSLGYPCASHSCQGVMECRDCCNCVSSPSREFAVLDEAR